MPRVSLTIIDSSHHGASPPQPSYCCLYSTSHIPEILSRESLWWRLYQRIPFESMYGLYWYPCISYIRDHLYGHDRRKSGQSQLLQLSSAAMLWDSIWPESNHRAWNSMHSSHRCNRWGCEFLPSGDEWSQKNCVSSRRQRAYFFSHPVCFDVLDSMETLGVSWKNKLISLAHLSCSVSLLSTEDMEASSATLMEPPPSPPTQMQLVKLPRDPLTLWLRKTALKRGHPQPNFSRHLVSFIHWRATSRILYAQPPMISSCTL